MNITTEPEGIAAAVLIRAVEPMEGIEEMKRNRGNKETHRVASGPGNLTRAMRIDRSLNGEDVVKSGSLFLERGRWRGKIGITTRVGVTSGTSLKWRYFIKDSPFVSKGKPSRLPQNP